MSVTGVSTTSPSQATLQQDLQSLRSAWQSGDLSTAKQSFAQLMQDMQGQGGTGQPKGMHGRHHHHGTAGASPTSSTQTASTSSTTSDPNQLAQNLLSVPVSGLLGFDPTANPPAAGSLLA
ncbi:hypothetical protein [Geomesophilobacter sediminis]|uniref:Uncharacterized protein n=1 Tax=Geomesophilobacter sediminis TaxID=2798584 RepID=A0A8J7M136_9BACT|nr:hypothetical protein [Geomesophilobacter sediminis]MBJ6726679.1 hypothetical protein [Geomesophilobacter sediminis]